MGEFVVSPKPDVRVIKIDTKKFRCLIFGTDGLWNVVRPQLAVDNVFAAEQLNEHNISSGGQREWINPSKNLVDKALERWSNTRMRADNTSVVIIMLDPPGPPKRDVILRASSTSPQQMEYLPNLLHPVDGQAVSPKPETTENFTMFDHKTNKLIDLDPIPAPTSGVAVMTRYENTNGVASNYCDNSGGGDRGTIYNTMQTVTNTPNTSALNYMNSFAESYSLFNANVDGYGIYNSVDTAYPITENGNASQQLHHTDTYRLTRLETRTEQQLHSRHEYLNESGAEVLVTAYTSYEDHNYGAVNQAASSGTSLPTPAKELPIESSVSETFPPEESFYENHRLMFSPDRNDVTAMENTAKSIDPSNGQATTSQHMASNSSTKTVDAMETDNEFDNSAGHDLPLSDESIQINEISSSGDELASSTDDQKLKLLSPQKLQANKTNGAHDQIPERKVTRSTVASQVNEIKVRRSQRNDQKLHQILNKTPMKCKKLPIGVSPKFVQNLKQIMENTHKENRSVQRRVVLHITKTTATTTTTNSPPATCSQRTRSTTLQKNNNDTHHSNNNTIYAGKRTLRSQNTKSLHENLGVNTKQQNGASTEMMALRPNQVKTVTATTTNNNIIRPHSHSTRRNKKVNRKRQ